MIKKSLFFILTSMSGSVIASNCTSIAVGDLSEEIWQKPTLVSLQDNVHNSLEEYNSVHFVFQFFGNNTAEVASHSLTKEDIKDSYWVQLTGDSISYTFLKEGEVVTTNNFIDVKNDLLGRKIKIISFVGPFHEDISTKKVFYSGYDENQLRFVVDKIKENMDFSNLSFSNTGIQASIYDSGHNIDHTKKKKYIDVLLEPFNDINVEYVVGAKLTLGDSVLNNGVWESTEHSILMNELNKKEYIRMSGANEIENKLSLVEVRELYLKLIISLNDNSINFQTKLNLMKRFTDKVGVDISSNNNLDRMLNTIRESVEIKKLSYTLIDSVESINVNFFPDLEKTTALGKPYVIDRTNGASVLVEDIDYSYIHNASLLLAKFDNFHNNENFNINSAGTFSINDTVPDVDFISSLDIAFLIQMLMTERGALTSDSEKALYYLNLSRTSISVISQAGSFVNLLNSATKFSQELSISTKILMVERNIIPLIGYTADALNIAFDLWLLAEAKSKPEQVIANAHLTIDSLSIVAALGLATIELDLLAVPIAGVSLGILALVENFEELQLRHDATLDEYLKLNRNSGILVGFNDFWSFQENLPISSINLDNGQVEPGSIFINLTKGGSGQVGNSWFACPEPDVDNWTNIYNSIIDVSLWNRKLEYKEGQSVVLPHTPDVYYHHEYELAPGALVWSGPAVDVMNKIENDHPRFNWRAMCGAERLYDIKHVSYALTNINVNMNKKSSHVIIPSLSDETRRFIHYHIKDKGGINTVSLTTKQPNVDYYINDGVWVLDITNIWIENYGNYSNKENIKNEILSNIKLVNDELRIFGQSYGKMRFSSENSIKIHAGVNNSGLGFEKEINHNGEDVSFSFIHEVPVNVSDVDIKNLIAIDGSDKKTTIFKFNDLGYVRVYHNRYSTDFFVKDAELVSSDDWCLTVPKGVPSGSNTFEHGGYLYVQQSNDWICPTNTYFNYAPPNTNLIHCSIPTSNSKFGVYKNNRNKIVLDRIYTGAIDANGTLVCPDGASLQPKIFDVNVYNTIVDKFNRILDIEESVFNLSSESRKYVINRNDGNVFVYSPGLFGDKVNFGTVNESTQVDVHLREPKEIVESKVKQISLKKRKIEVMMESSALDYNNGKDLVIYSLSGSGKFKPTSYSNISSPNLEVGSNYFWNYLYMINNRYDSYTFEHYQNESLPSDAEINRSRIINTDGISYSVDDSFNAKIKLSRIEEQLLVENSNKSIFLKGKIIDQVLYSKIEYRNEEESSLSTDEKPLINIHHSLQKLMSLTSGNIVFDVSALNNIETDIQQYFDFNTITYSELSKGNTEFRLNGNVNLLYRFENYDVIVLIEYQESGVVKELKFLNILNSNSEDVYNKIKFNLDNGNSITLKSLMNSSIIEG